ncbi:restriction endonuclease [Changpingibacter yushuensis]|uniref:restriction endonuclease n=1 Tax=Changpingibacter yushuensis TaxID=2758440 RepID=UPI00165DADE6|nr:restriction endonuclease [Changpingibacter yushuensis]
MSGLPTWEGFMIPTLKVLSDGKVRHWREFRPLVADLMGLSEEQRGEKLPSGDYTYLNRIGWAVSFLTNIGALDRPRRAHYQITPAGTDLITIFPNGARERDIKVLGLDPASPIRLYESTVKRPTKTAQPTPDEESSSMTPLEQVQSGIDRINQDVATELLARLQGKEPAFFEQAVVQLLLAMGYGGTTGTGSVTQLSNDGGIDGVIDQDVLGLNRVYIQAKRYAQGNTVGRPDLQAFVGALSGKADSGVFITTSRFSEGATIYAQNVPTRIILIDGQRLTSLMIRYGVGVQIRQTYHAVDIDEDFFE